MADGGSGGSVGDVAIREGCMDDHPRPGERRASLATQERCQNKANSEGRRGAGASSRSVVQTNKASKTKPNLGKMGRLGKERTSRMATGSVGKRVLGGLADGAESARNARSGTCQPWRKVVS
jgi:hypothetical protein